jgi:hypothetical protein
LFQDADSLAARAEEKYHWLVRTKISLLIAAAVAASVTLSPKSDLARLAAIALSILLVGSMAFTAFVKIMDYDQIWSDSRAVAEALKSETWSFMMKVGLYEGRTANPDAEERFLERQRDILQKRPELYPYLTSDFEEAVQITDHMRKMRNEALESRRDYYAQNRVRDQRLWYMKKAKWNRNQGALWFAIGWILEILAIASAIVMINQQNVGINPVGIITAAGAGVLSWISSRSYNEPAGSYGFTAQELLLFEEKMKQISTEERLADAVLKVEGIIAREHMIWLARLY